MFPIPVIVAAGMFLTSTLAQASATFSNTSFIGPVTVGQVWPIGWTVGNGKPVSLAFGNSSWAYSIFTDRSAPGSLVWTVEVPSGVVDGRYQLALTQADGATEYSPIFQLSVPPTATMITSAVPTATVTFPTDPTLTVTAVYISTAASTGIMPTVTYIYYDNDCSCHKTSSCLASALPTSMSTTTMTYSEMACGCTTTITAPCAPTVLPVSSASNWTSSAMNTPVAPTTSPAAPVNTAATSSYTGEGARLTGSAFGVIALIAAVFIA